MVPARWVVVPRMVPARWVVVPRMVPTTHHRMVPTTHHIGWYRPSIKTLGYSGNISSNIIFIISSRHFRVFIRTPHKSCVK
jgi:hypothetical protein